MRGLKSQKQNTKASKTADYTSFEVHHYYLEKEREARERVMPEDDEEIPEIPPEVVLIARRNRRTHYLLPTKDASFCGVPCEHVMIDSGCNTALLPFPKDTRDLDRFSAGRYYWTINSSGGTGAVHMD